MHLQMPAIGPNYDGFVPLCNASQVPTKGGWFLKDSIPLKKNVPCACSINLSLNDSQLIRPSMVCKQAEALQECSGCAANGLRLHLHVLLLTWDGTYRGLGIHWHPETQVFVPMSSKTNPHHPTSAASQW